MPNTVAGLILLTLFTLCAPAQDDAIFHSDVALVRIDAEVTDSAGEILPGLTSEDFQVFDHGAEQPIRQFSFGREPLDLILLFDAGKSMRSGFHQVLKAVELGFHELQPGDRVCVMAFGSTSIELAPFTSDLDAVNNAIALKLQGLNLGGAPNFAAAAVDAALRFRRERVTERRRAVLAVSNQARGLPFGLDAIRAFWQSDAVFSELILGHSQGDNALARQSGGAVVSGPDPGAAFVKAVRGLRRRYTLYYALPADAAPGAERSIEVRVRRTGALVHARTGYIVPGR